MAIERIDDFLQHIEKASEEFVLFLAKKFNVPLKTLKKSKNQEDKQKFYDTRRKEILSAYIDNIKDPKTFLLQLPPRFFNPYEQGKATISIQLKEKEKELYEQINTKWKSKIKNEFQRPFVDYAELLHNKENKTIEMAKKINNEIIKEILITKALAQMNLDFNSRQDWEFAKYPSGSIDYATVIYKYKNFSITAPVKELLAFNSLFSADRFTKMLDYLAANEPGKKSYTLQEIKRAIFQHLWESREFISKCLELDKEYAERYKKEVVEKSKEKMYYYQLVNRKLTYFKMFDPSSNEVVSRLDIDADNWGKWIKYRKNAFHADILPPGETYEKLCEEVGAVINKLKGQSVH